VTRSELSIHSSAIAEVPDEMELDRALAMVPSRDPVNSLEVWMIKKRGLEDLGQTILISSCATTTTSAVRLITRSTASSRLILPPMTTGRQRLFGAAQTAEPSGGFGDRMNGNLREAYAGSKSTCPRCKGKNVRRCHRSGILDHLVGLLGWGPYRCSRCYRRFYAWRTKLTAAETEPADQRPGIANGRLSRS
jgi:hypothetical protein